MFFLFSASDNGSKWSAATGVTVLITHFFPETRLTAGMRENILYFMLHVTQMRNESGTFSVVQAIREKLMTLVTKLSRNWWWRNWNNRLR